MAHKETDNANNKLTKRIADADERYENLLYQTICNILIMMIMSECL